MWNVAYRDGYNAGMGDHRSYFYHKHIEAAGFYDVLKNSKRIAEFAPGSGDFIKKCVIANPKKEFVLLEIAEKNLKQIKTSFSEYKNVRCLLNYPSANSPINIDLAFSFLLCQSMPRCLWEQHLRETYRVLSVGGSYIFQFASFGAAAANDSLGDALAGSQMYLPEVMKTLLPQAGFNTCNVSEAITLKELHSDVLWYVAKGIK
jgi:hypothetical protein